MDLLCIAVIIPKETPQTRWIRVYCPLGMADLFGAYDKWVGIARARRERACLPAAQAASVCMSGMHKR
jgi:hypothetical protein